MPPPMSGRFRIVDALDDEDRNTGPYNGPSRTRESRQRGRTTTRPPRQNASPGDSLIFAARNMANPDQGGDAPGGAQSLQAMALQLLQAQKKVPVVIRNPLWFLDVQNFAKPPPPTTRVCRKRKRAEMHEFKDDESIGSDLSNCSEPLEDIQEDEIEDDTYCAACMSNDEDGTYIHVEKGQMEDMERIMIEGLRTGRYEVAVNRTYDKWNNAILPGLRMAGCESAKRWSRESIKAHIFLHTNDPFLNAMTSSMIDKGLRNLVIMYGIAAAPQDQDEDNPEYEMNIKNIKLASDLNDRSTKHWNESMKLYAPKTTRTNESAQSYMSKSGRGVSIPRGKKPPRNTYSASSRHRT